MNERHKRIVMGVEIEAYTISTPGHRITRRMAFPRKGLGEKGERFTRDASIGTEYVGRPFASIREGLFLLKAGDETPLTVQWHTERTLLSPSSRKLFRDFVRLCARRRAARLATRAEGAT